MAKPSSAGKPAGAGKPATAGKPAWAGNAGGAVRGLARAMAVGRGKKLGIYKRQSAPAEQTGVPVGGGATALTKSNGKAKGKGLSR